MHANGECNNDDRDNNERYYSVMLVSIDNNGHCCMGFSML